MSLRTFTVFQDAPSTEQPKPKPANASRIIRPSSSNSENSNHAPILPIFDKENVHPVTGERAGPSSTDPLQKRKTNVLTTKMYVPLATKPLKESKGKDKSEKDAQPLAKKRKSTAIAKGKVSSKKDVKTAASTRKLSKRASPKFASLPKLVEEPEKEKERVSVDSKCYELTVKPLADVSDAYEHLSPVDEALDEKVKFGLIKASSAEPEIRDYFSPPLTASTTCVRSASEGPKPEAYSFSTPERRKIYAAFTFSSPSPIGKRFKEAPTSSHNVLA